MKLSHLSETLIGSEIVKLAGEIRERISQGENIYNFTVGDFDPKIFPIPKRLEEEIIEAYRNHFTNYPAAEGNLDLRKSISSFAETFQGLKYNPNEILVASGGRPLIYAIYRTICDPGDKVIYAVPSWNNNHYTHFVSAEHVVIETGAESNFMPRAEDIRPHLGQASLIALCSPQNPTGTTFRKKDLEEICEMVVEENRSRGDDRKKLYMMYDQMYWQLTYGDIVHYDPVSLNPAMRDYTIYVDAISKVFAATGVRVGWSMGPAAVLNKMKAILSHVGAWAPMAEQKAMAKFLLETDEIKNFLSDFKAEIEERLRGIYDGIMELKSEGLNVDAVAPEAAIYLTLKMDLAGMGTPEGGRLQTQSDISSYIMKEAGLAIVPFYAFGADRQSPWYRLSVGTCRKEDIGDMISRLRQAVSRLTKEKSPA